MATRDSAWPDGTPCWVDHAVPDVEAAQRFYGDVLDWQYEGGEPEYGGYLTATTRGLPAAGLGPQTDPAQPPRWTTYFATSDAGAATARITAAGGTVVVPPMPVGTMGTMVVAVDPQGTAFALWQAGEHVGARVVNEPGSLVWNEAAVPDPAAARDFYAAVFGFTFTPVEDMPEYTTFATDERPLGGLSGSVPGLPDGWGVCFAVSDTDAAVSLVERGGGKVLLPAEDTPFGRFAVVEDPWGAPFSVMDVAEEDPPS